MLLTYPVPSGHLRHFKKYTKTQIHTHKSVGAVRFVVRRRVSCGVAAETEINFTLLFYYWFVTSFYPTIMTGELKCKFGGAYCVGN